MTEELEQKAEKYAQKYINHKMAIHDIFDLEVVQKDITRLLIEFATENDIQWHDLRKDPNDLPDTNRFVHVQTMSDTGKAYYDKGWYSGQISGIVIAWCEEPKFKE